MTPLRLGLLLAALVFALDQGSKYWIVHVFALGERPPVRLLPFLDLVLAHNKGISYSLFRADGLAGRLILIVVALGALGVLVLWLARTPRRLTAVALGLVAGGAAGNVLDRMTVGAVIDFLYFHTPFPLGPLSNYVFNVADAAIVVGVALLLYESVRGEPPSPEPVKKG